MELISPERKRELAIRAVKQRADSALELVSWFGVIRILRELDDFAGMSRQELREAAEEIAALARSGEITVTFPELYENAGDPTAVDDDAAPPIVTVHPQAIDGRDAVQTEHGRPATPYLDVTDQFTEPRTISRGAAFEQEESNQ